MDTSEDCSLELSLALPEGWTFSLQLKRGEEGSHGGLAELHEDGVLRCRMLLSNLDSDRKVALDRVATRVELWLVEWQSRDHSGNSDFADL